MWLIVGAVAMAAVVLALMYAAVLVASNDDRKWRR